MSQKITFIGGGNMATSLIAGLIANGHSADCITVSEPDANKLKALQERYKIQINTNNNQAVTNSEVVVLAVKPQILQAVCRAMAEAVQKQQPLIISIAAGIRSVDIDRWLGDQCALIRCMPNTPSLLQAGASGLFANKKTTATQKTIAENVLSTAGLTLWVKQENLLDAVTAISGSGPAYFFLLMEAMKNTGEKLGLDAESAQKLALQTALGAARMAIEGSDDPATLRTKVTSKGGTTEAAINHFIENGFNALVNDALHAAHTRAIELADELGQDQ